MGSASIDQALNDNGNRATTRTNHEEDHHVVCDDHQDHVHNDDRN